MKPVVATPPKVILLDIEGTTTPVSFVHRVLFPYARKILPDLIKRRRHDPVVEQALAATKLLAPGKEPAEQLLTWMNEDAKVAPLKTLQGQAWAEGYADGTLVASLFPDVPPVLRAWYQTGLTLAVYSSGSSAAQKLIYAHTTDGDLTSLFSAFLDLEMGGKKDTASYRKIITTQGWVASDVLFVSDVVAELDAAGSAGMLTCQMVRTEDETVAGDDHPVAHDMTEVATLFALPAPASACL
ncbi:acireductone synthase [Acetobacter oeni]|uniref:Enolase-phosphatase E1 n=1 Tax=Acetobacter oeni TaxID=304077 RepID=A0A511XG17_9PROT|nr:acireductone synthase [Acetobacter oeni]MBB3882182.1 enolase-phosphatase E1 [Acetobacter oeni]NHO17939.1 acireductone synthase [Acetobacter oeni]GBR01405.1 2,3-diketo-5-methylthio-1-phosphopentane phosphatase [Acetobacter oeni LMG 21952]GEN61897.1 enolase-phosphatase E1 [Acetobacter oeni]